MRQTERKVAYPHCDKQGNITQVNYIEIKDKKLAEEKLCKFEDIEEKYNISSLDDLENILAALDVIKEHKLLNYVLKNEKCANMYHLSKEKCDLLKEILK